MSGQEGEQGAERGGRYNRSFDGLLGAMIMTILIVIGFVIFRNVFSNDIDESDPQPVEYVEAVQGLQANGFQVVYPPTLPEGWIVRDVDFEPGDRPEFRLDLFTDDGGFVGIRQADVDVDDLLEQYVDDDASEDEPLEGVGSVATTWQGWSDSGGDHAFSATVGEDTVLVYGSVSADDLAELVAVLTQDPVPTSPGPADPS